MQRKKHRVKQLSERRALRDKNSKKIYYHQKHANNELGNKELENYRVMYHDWIKNIEQILRTQKINQM